MKKMIVVVLIAGIAGGIAWWFSLPAQPVTVTLPPGASTPQIASLLADANVVSSRAAFMLWARVSGKAHRLRAGTYVFSPRDSLFRVVSRLTRGRNRNIKVTIPEGYTAAQIAATLAEKKLAAAEHFMAVVSSRTLEGWLFPQTYFFDPGLSAEGVAAMMQAEFRKNYPPEYEARAHELGMTERAVVTLASLIEKEAVAPEERARIAGVFYNRLRKHWLLESCATVQYALGERKTRLSLADTRIDSPYNTYRYPGLPPGPICNPGSACIRAALYPEATHDMFFVASGTGTHVFSRYYQDHLVNKRQQRRNKAARAGRAARP
jgi:UPF0755 protein